MTDEPPVVPGTPGEPEPAPVAVPSRTLKHTAILAAKWTTIAGILTGIVGFVQGIVVARIIGPEEFGLVAVALVVVTFGHVVADGGLGAAIIARRLDRDVLSSMFWLNTMLGVTLAVAVFALAGPLGDLFGKDGLASVIRWSAFVFLFSGPTAQFTEVLRRDLDFGHLAFQQTAATVVAFVVAVVSALLGAGAVSLIWAAIVSTAAQAVLGGYACWDRAAPTKGFHPRLIRPHLGFGLYQLGDRLTAFGTTNADSAIIGRVLGTAALGPFALAYQLVTKPLMVINPMVTAVAFPVFAKRQDDDDALAYGLGETVRAIAYVALPLLVGIAITAPDLVEVVLGPEWEESVVLIQILCLLGAFRCLTNPVGSVLLAKDRADVGFAGGLVFFVATVAGLVIAVPSGTEAAAWTEAGLMFAFWIAWLLILRWLIRLPIGGFGLRLAAPFAANAALLGALVVSRLALDDADPAIRLIGAVAVGTVAYLAAAVLLDRRWIVENGRLLRGGATPSPAPS